MSSDWYLHVVSANENRVKIVESDSDPVYRRVGYDINYEDCIPVEGMLNKRGGASKFQHLFDICMAKPDTTDVIYSYLEAMELMSILPLTTESIDLLCLAYKCVVALLHEVTCDEAQFKLILLRSIGKSIWFRCD